MKPDDVPETPFEIRTHASMRELGEEAYRGLLDEHTPPFLRFEWLDALERTGCVVPKRGWLPMHLGIYQGGELVAAAPAYVKGNSEGEFVFDCTLGALPTRQSACKPGWPTKPCRRSRRGRGCAARIC